MNKTIRFLHITDTHIGPTKNAEVSFSTPYPLAERVVNKIKSIQADYDFIVHTGDIVYDPDNEAYNLAKNLFGEINLPIYFVRGNHDSNTMMWSYLNLPPVNRAFPDKEWFCYSFKINNLTFIALDADNGSKWQGVIPKEQIAFLENTIKETNQKIIVLMHFPPFPVDSIWADEAMLLENPYDLHNVLKKYSNRVSAVIHGHIHRNIVTHKDGILYYAGTAVASEFNHLPHKKNIETEPAHVPSISAFSLTNENLTIKHIACID
jgi:Icc protein